MISAISDNQTDYTSHQFKRLDDIDLSYGNDLYGPSSSRRASSSRSSSSASSSKQTNFTGATTTKGQQPIAPGVSIIIDQQPDYLDYGQSISGRLFVDTKGSPSQVRVTNLRVSLFGNARVHGDQPEQPLTAGLFDYKNDVKILSTGIRIVKRTEPVSPFLTKDEQLLQQQQNVGRRRSKDKARMVEPDDFDIHTSIHHDEEGVGTHSGEDINNNDWMMQDNNYSNRKSSSKHARDKAVEQLMQQIALCAPSSEPISSRGLSLQILNAPQNDEEDKPYDLEASKNHRIRFSIPITTHRMLPGTDNDKNHPIQYHLVALLIYATDSNPNARWASHTVQPLVFRPSPIETFKDEAEMNELAVARHMTSRPVSLWITNSRLDQLVLSVKSKQTVKTMPPPKTSSLSQHDKYNSNSSSRPLVHNKTTWMTRLFHHLSTYYVQRRKVLETPYLKCSLELPHKTFGQGDAIPLRVHVENTGLDIAQVIVETKLKQHLYMTYHCGEQVDSKLIDQATTLFTGNDKIQPVPVDNNDQSSIRSTANDSGMELKWEGGRDDIPTPAASTPAAEIGSLCSSRNIVFDLTKVLYVPDHCASTVLPEMTKDTFEVSYELQITVSVIGARVISTTQESARQSCFYASADQHFSRSSITRSKGYILKPPTIPIIIGSERKLI
ncbi:hypothetical protein BDB00DRAFT_820801 [Zychaea mexicana]|uniref:uncharacterized protein n=1 Tax=Zychaea mexicana TaxID=64656 RepID=UPI0022FE6674|nr:uncharacterized protein BDB00DRAFT_820801 [Zychaea mexicana]KAI9494084.1 hypothetical protein BDB00DRAFT_820801 [Zychaea mexicana]